LKDITFKTMGRNQTRQKQYKTKQKQDETNNSKEMGKSNKRN